MSTVETSRIWSDERISTSTRLLIHGSKCARRPEMLEDLKSTFTMYIYTMGTKAYAEEVKKILDPCGVIFGKRVLSRCDTPDLNIKLLSKLKLADTDTLIVDDTQRSGANTGGIYYR
jgi:TFIIF-interacting CTD phosphatase-like protein